MENIVTISHGKPMTTSLVIAERFGKQHKSVLRAIRTLNCSTEFNRHNFALVEYIDEKGEHRPMYNISRDGFSFLAMGFTGKEAAQWKEKFITAFNAMESELVKLSQLHSDPDWQQARIEGKASRREETNAIKDLVDYAIAQGSANAGNYYLLLTKAVHKELFVLDSGSKVNRDDLTAPQLTALGIAERVVGKAIADAIAAGRPYRDIYRVAFDKVRQFADLIGRTVPREQNLIAQK